MSEDLVDRSVKGGDVRSRKFPLHRARPGKVTSCFQSLL